MPEEKAVLKRGQIIRQTDKAWLVEFDGVSDEHWLPKSQCEHYPSSGMFSIPRWLAAEKDLLE